MGKAEVSEGITASLMVQVPVQLLPRRLTVLPVRPPAETMKERAAASKRTDPHRPPAVTAMTSTQPARVPKAHAQPHAQSPCW
jgi:hypothetical protein